jgi:hypothetical protein
MERFATARTLPLLSTYSILTNSPCVSCQQARGLLINTIGSSDPCVLVAFPRSAQLRRTIETEAQSSALCESRRPSPDVDYIHPRIPCERLVACFVRMLAVCFQKLLSQHTSSRGASSQLHRSRKRNLHAIIIPKRLETARTLPTPIRNKPTNTGLTESMAASLEHRVAHVD